MWSDVVALFREYMGTGLIVIWFIVSLIYLWVNEKRRYLRILLIYMPIVLLLLYFNPLFARLVYGLAGSEIYYRILWLLPITIVIAYTCVSIYGKLTGLKQGVFALCMAAVIGVSGSYIYSNPFFGKAENIYHVPDSVVHICDAINVPGREVRAVFPEELLQYVRQYSAVTCMPYGREITVDRWHHNNSLYDVMEAEIIDLEKAVPLIREAYCHYVVLPADKEIKGKPSDFGWELFAEMDGYVIYRDPAAELIIPELDE